MQPRYYQTEANNAVWRYLRETQGNPVVVLPTGAGKSLLAAMIVKQTLAYGARCLILQHRKELIQQNAEKVRILLPGVSVGINSAGLRRHSFDDDVICCGIQTVYKKALEFGRRELILIDEAHLIGGNEDSMYGRFIADLKKVNPKLRIAGLTATPYRTGEGPICQPDKIFTRICYEVMTGDLIAQGFLSPLTNRPADAAVDTSSIKSRGGEFIPQDAERAFDTDDNVSAACQEIVAKCHGRRSVLVFCSGVHHAGSVAGVLSSLTGEEVGIVTGETFPMERERVLSDFRAGALRWCVNVDVLTTGFDSPRIDAIAVLRATMSPGLFAQIVGRGLRKSDGKEDCLILDFGENIQRHGSIDDPNYGRASVSSGGGSGNGTENNGRGKQCPNCKLDVAPRAAFCPECGFVFPANHQASADHNSAITGEQSPEEWKVGMVTWFRHEKKSDPEALPTLRIDYKVYPADGTEGNLSGKHVSEWVCIEHHGYAHIKAGLWWNQRSVFDMPNTVDEALSMMNRGACRHASKIWTKRDGKFYRIVRVEFSDEIPEAMQDEEEEVEVRVYSGVDGDVPF